MFIITDEPTFRHDVKVKVPCDGGHREETISATFRVVSDEETDSHDLYARESSTAWLRRIIVKLDGLVDLEKKPVPYSDAVRDHVLSLPYARLALAQAYLAAVTKAREGN